MNSMEPRPAHADLPPQFIEQMYPPVPVEMLVADEWQRRFHEYFLDSREFPADPFQVAVATSRPHRKCVSVCLFRQNVNNRFPHEFPVDGEAWSAKYWNGLVDVVRDLAAFPEWKLRICVEKDLWEQVRIEFGHHSQVELHGMSVNSVGQSPGALWRFLALADRTLDVVLVTDIDEPFPDKRDCIRTFEMDSWSAIGRIGGFVSDRRYLVAPQESRVKNYATIIGSRNISRPARFDFDVAAALRGFIAWRRWMSTTDRPWAYGPDEQPSPYNQPIGGHPYGWGSHWFMYGFDERFLKHVVYYHFAKKGEIHTWAPSLPPSQLDPEGLCDLQHVRARGNTTLCPQTAVRLAALDLAPEALRAAFVLDEHRWIFESLRQLMLRNAHAGLCGCVFFHDMADPYAVELVPKQLNLFQAARHASRALEIGFNAGHSAAIMLLANPRLIVRAFDTCSLAYVRPCFDFLVSIFGNRLSLVEGPSQVTVPADAGNGYDLTHIDADHTYAAVAADLANSLPKCVPGAIVVMDDYEGANEVAQATQARSDLVPTDRYTLRRVIPGSAHAIFHKS